MFGEGLTSAFAGYSATGRDAPERNPEVEAVALAVMKVLREHLLASAPEVEQTSPMSSSLEWVVRFDEACSLRIVEAGVTPVNAGKVYFRIFHSEILFGGGQGYWHYKMPLDPRRPGCEISFSALRNAETAKTMRRNIQNLLAWWNKLEEME